MLSYHQDRIALGSRADLVLVSGGPAGSVEEAFRRLWLEIFNFENRFSRFLPASELSQFNRAAGRKQFVGPEFKAVLVAAKAAAEKSEGLYNPFILPALQKAGYVKSLVAAHNADEVDDFSSAGVSDIAKLEIGDDWARIPYNTALDMGGCGKGYLGDLLIELANTFSGISGYWFSLGGDIVAGGLNEDGKPWIVYVESTARDNDGLAGRIELTGPDSYAVATSSILRRKGKKDGKAWHHIIDPQTGLPAETDILTATVYSKSALAADILASSAIIKGIKGVKSYLFERGALGVLLQTADHRIISWGAVSEGADS